ncbi:MAG: amidohydrolase family protein, partial [Nocardioidaceae bacterium]
PGTLEAVTEEVASFGGLLLVHAEDPATLATCDPGSTRYADFLASRPDGSEQAAVAAVVAAAGATGCRVHVVHVSSGTALAVITAARAAGGQVSAETCPHYLSFTAEQVPDGATEFKCCPPIRGTAHRDALWAGLAAGSLDIVVSDHSPCPPELKNRDTGRFADAWGGIGSVQLGLPAVWSGASRRGHTLADVVGWMATGPADFAGLPAKGRIAPGADADFCVFAPEQTFTVDPRQLRQRHTLSPYTGRVLTGVVRQTWLRGSRVDLDGPPRGRLLSRGE